MSRCFVLESLEDVLGFVLGSVTLASMTAPGIENELTRGVRVLRDRLLCILNADMRLVARGNILRLTLWAPVGYESTFNLTILGRD